MDINWLDYKLNPWYSAVKDLSITFTVILKDTFVNQEKFPFYRGGQ